MQIARTSVRTVDNRTESFDDREGRFGPRFPTAEGARAGWQDAIDRLFPALLPGNHCRGPGCGNGCSSPGCGSPREDAWLRKAADLGNAQAALGAGLRRGAGRYRSVMGTRSQWLRIIRRRAWAGRCSTAMAAASAKSGKEELIAMLDQAANPGSAGAEHELGGTDQDSQNAKKDKNHTMDCAGKGLTGDRGGQSSSSDRCRLLNPQRPATG
jgi:hypothetical protein